MATDWSEAAKARRSEAAKKAAATRKANQAKKSLAAHRRDENAEMRVAHREKIKAPNSRVARWTLSGVSILAMMRGVRHFRWHARTFLMSHAFDSGILNNRTNSYT